MTSVYVARLTSGDPHEVFLTSFLNLVLYDASNCGYVIPGGGMTVVECGSSRIPEGRNQLTERFLDTDHEWMWMVDSDMGFEPDALQRLVASADPEERPAVGGLCFGQQPVGRDDMTGAVRHETFPTLYRWVETDERAGFLHVNDYPRGEVVQVGGTGAACLLIHRSAVEAVREKYGNEWFSPVRWKTGETFSEDLSFCLRLAGCGIPLHADTSVRTVHAGKRLDLTEHIYLAEQQAKAHVPNFVVIPTIERLDLLRPLVTELHDQGEAEALFVMDNGATGEFADWLDEQTMAEVHECHGWTLHEMWNRGIDLAQQRSLRSNVAILNDDIKIGPDFLSTLAEGLRGDEKMGVVSPNYDGRDLDGVEETGTICAGRYDGTGGVAGFAFMLRGETNYRFPTELQTWFGDNHLVATAVKAGWKCGIVGTATCEHVDGGSGTYDYENAEVKNQIAHDERWFRTWLERAS